MRQGLWLAALLVGAGAWVSPSHCGAESPPTRSIPDDSDSVFGEPRVWKVHLHVTADNWKAMQPPPGAGFPGFGPPGTGGPPGGAGPGARPGGAAPGPPSGPPANIRPGDFGFDFEYAKADVEFDDEVIANVGLRLKGNGTYMMSMASRKRPFKIDFDRFVDGQKFHGLQQLNLHNNVMDPTHLRQALSYPVFTAAGIPAPRTAFADVTLTIDGECDHQWIGLYTLVEEVDKTFLKRHFESNKGMLLKPEGTQGLEYKGENWADYAWFEPKSKPEKEESQQLIDITRLIAKADDETFRREIGTLLDTDEFARFLAANTLLANMDSFLTQVHNYYVYLPPQSKKFVFLPWDLDLSMGAFFLAGSAEQLQDLSISHPHMGQNKLIERLLAWDEFDRIYRGHLKQLTNECFGEEGRTRKSLPVMQQTLQKLIERETKRVADEQAAARQGNPFGGGFGPGGFPGFGGGPSMETFMTKRRESILAQLDGKSKGREPGMSFGPPGGGGPGFGPPSGGPPGGFGPGNFIGPPMLKAADTDNNQRVSKEEWAALYDKWFETWDKNKDAQLDTPEITSGLNSTFAPPPGGPANPQPK